MKTDHSAQKPCQKRDEPPGQARQRDNNAGKSMKPDKKEKGKDDERACATSVNVDEKWKEELLNKLLD